MGRLITQNMTKYGLPGTVWLGTGIALPATLPAPLPRVHPSPTYPSTPASPGPHRQYQGAVGLKSVAQLTLGPQISDIRGITEVYNLSVAGDPNDHKFIPRTN